MELTQEQIENINIAVKRIIEVFKEVAQKVGEFIKKAYEMWKEFLLDICKNNKSIRKLNYIYHHTKKKRIRKKQMKRLIKILVE